MLAEVAEGGEEGDGQLPMTGLGQAAGVFIFLAAEPDLYPDADTLERNG